MQTLPKRPAGYAATIFAVLLLLSPRSASGDIIAFEASDFGLTTVFSNVTTFEFTIDIADPIVAGQTYTNPALNSVDYRVFGTLAATPSGFPAFNLVRSITHADFYAQGSSLSFAIDAAADLTDGLQLSELTGTDPVFVFNGREVGTGRYHPALVELNADGTGRIQNSNNFGGVNPFNMMTVDVTFGEEYITDLTFNASSLTLIQNVSQVPEPTGLWMAGLAVGAWLMRRRRGTAAD